MKTTITFSTNVWEETYRKLLISGELEREYDKIGYDFDNKHILINNVVDKKKVADIITRDFPDWNFYFISDIAGSPEFKKTYEIDFNSLGKAYYYTIQHLVRFYVAQYLVPKCEYVFYISEDCKLENINSTFISDSISILKKHEEIICTMPSWDKTMAAPKGESRRKLGCFYVAKGFTDQVYFAKAETFRKKIYHFSHYDSARYPEYAGECFEKRINSYMETQDKFRAIHEKFWYTHGK